jgi:hypothetical protein
MVVGNEFRVFNSIPRWEVLCVDEGQRRKYPLEAMTGGY